MRGTILVAGWLSFASYRTGAGDVLAIEVVCRWLREANEVFDVAARTPIVSGSNNVDWREMDPARYTDVIFVGGPIGQGSECAEFLRRFSDARLTGINVSMLEPLDRWN